MFLKVNELLLLVNLFLIRYRKLTIINISVGKREGDDVVSRIGDEEDDTVFHDLLHLASRVDLVDEIRDDERHETFDRRLAEHENGGDDRDEPVLADTPRKSFQHEGWNTFLRKTGS